MKRNKLSKKIVILSTIFIIVGLFALIFHPWSSELNNNEKEVVGKTYLNIFVSAGHCIDQVKSLQFYVVSGVYNKEILEQEKNNCSEAAKVIKSIEIPNKIPDKMKLILQNSKENYIKSCNYIASAHEEFIKTDGNYDFDNKHFKNYNNILGGSAKLPSMEMNNAKPIFPIVKKYLIDLKRNKKKSEKLIDNNQSTTLKSINSSYKRMDEIEISCIKRYNQNSEEEIKKNNFDENFLKQSIKACNIASQKIKITPIPQKLPQHAKNVLQNSREKISDSCRYIALSFEELLKTKGDYSLENIHFKNRFKYFGKSYINIKLVSNNREILENLYSKKGYK